MIPGGLREKSVQAQLAKVSRWLRVNLFNSWSNTLLTLLTVCVVLVAVKAVVTWAVIDAVFGVSPESCTNASGACWSVIADMWQFFLVGFYPHGERWRIVVAAGLLVFLALATVIPGFRRSSMAKVLWILLPVAALILLRGGAFGLKEVETQLWGGLMLTLLLAAVGQGVAFPIGVLLALGRQSKRMPFVKALCVCYIELVRSVPLITILITASIILPLFMPSGVTVDKLLRAQLGIILFSAATIAEVVRGGLQGIPRGQEEAALAIGLTYWQMMRLIILPQALRMVMPALVGVFISFVKGTSLVAVVGLSDLLGTAMLITANPKWIGKAVEPLLIAAVIFWLLCYSISVVSRQLEMEEKTG